MKPPGDHMVEVGRLVGTHGLRGDLKLRPQPTGEDALRAGQEVLLQDDAAHPTTLLVERCTPHKQFLLIRFDGIGGLDAAQALVGQKVLVRRDQLSEPTEGRYFWCDLEGLSVIDQRRGLLGRIEDMFATAAHDVLVVQGPYGEVLIPAIPPFLLQLRAEDDQLLVDLPDGLVPEADDI